MSENKNIEQTSSNPLDITKSDHIQGTDEKSPG